jgi:phenylpyruvate tautomerase PptA (4-oxalocrotonate tautomerase family)
MPYYEIRHSYPLTPTQKQTFATKLTTLHAETFTAPSLFVNIQFSHITSDNLKDADFFIAGKPQSSGNRVLGQVRGGGTRGQEAFDKLAEDIQSIWNEVVGDDGTSNEKELHGVFIMPGLIARERGFAIPPVSRDPF